MRELLRPHVLVGPPGAGKSTLGRLVATRASLPYVDLDELVRERTGQTPAALLRNEGEASFRVSELEALRAALDESPPPLIAAGSGIVSTREARELLHRRARVTFLHVSATEALQRLAHDDVERPLLGAPSGTRGDPDADALERYRALVERRQPAWDALASARIDTTSLSLDEAASALHNVVTAVDRPVRPLDSPPREALFVAEGEHSLAARERAVLVLDDGVPESPALHGLLRAMGARPLLRVNGGEGQKTLESAGALAARLVDLGLPPDGVVVAAGGGAVLDLVGFVCATLYRGVRWLAVPTTLLAMVDASLGGKTAVSLPAGKNLVGAFHPPDALVIDPRFLSTLPERERRAGVVEMLKHALLAADAPLDGSPAPLDEGLPALAAGDASPTQAARLIARSLTLKGSVVESDPRERGLRVVLNLGHSLGHALEREAAARGRDLLHGEAVAEGLRFSLALSVERCGLDPDVAARMLARLDELEVPRASALAGPFDPSAVFTHLGVDKKRRGARQRFVGLASPGAPVVIDDVPSTFLRTWLMR